MTHKLDIHERDEEGRAFATCSCGWRAPVRCNDRKLVMEQARRHAHYIYEQSVRDDAAKKATRAEDDPPRVTRVSRPSTSSGDPTEAAS